jgi:TatA/E family protein of Tat protein translocase
MEQEREPERPRQSVDAYGHGRSVPHLQAKEQSIVETRFHFDVGCPRREYNVGLGFWELLLILFIVLLLFNRRIPELGESLGKGIRKFRKSVHESDEIDITPKDGDKDSRA